MFLLAWPLAEFGWVLTVYQRGIVGMKRVLEFLTAEPSVRETERTRPGLERIEGAIRFEDVDFAYDGRTILHNVTFEASPGQTIAIVGPTGSGKSSIITLLVREHDPLRGRVFIDGMDVREIPLRVLRSQIGYVPQDTFLFSDTIRANLTFGRPDAEASEIEYAADVAQFKDTAEQFPEGYDTLLGERGVNLSGGQKQRLAIARAVVRDPRILILDDALSSVDTQTEEHILRRLKHVMATRTSVIISHRVSTVRHADLILVLNNGRIVERGTHDTLVQQDGIYANMYERQLLEDELEERA
jgi:ATP-binding cassette subfamily B protein